MPKYIINSEATVKTLKGMITFMPGDIVVHKKLSFPEITGAFKNQFMEVELVPVSPGTESYSINGYNTSVIKSIGEPKN